jgi:hypothetical protein
MDNLEGRQGNTEQLQGTGSEMLAWTIARSLNECGWVNSNLKIQLCILFMQKILESKLGSTDNIALIQKIRKKPISFIIRFLKRYPDKGLQLLSQSVMEELRMNQKLQFGELVQFHTALLDLLFPPPAN